MRRQIPTVFVFFLGMACLSLISFAGFVGHQRAEAQKKDMVRPRPVVAAKRETPQEGQLYVFSLPDKGLQTLLVLKVIDGNSFEGAYLVPVRVRLDGVEFTQEKAKAAFDKLDGLIGGRLVNAEMRGKSKENIQLADIHLGEPKKDDPKSPSGWISELLKK